MNLLAFQETALEFFRNSARSRRDNAVRTIEHILKMSNVDRATLDLAVRKIQSHAKVALHFHPDRLDPEMKSVAQSLLDGGIYKSQFETLMSNGSVSAVPGGERDLWEKDLYGGAYHSEGSANSHRPKYGALDLMRHPDGPAPRFGSCYLLLRPEVTHRCTFTYLDSHQIPDEKGTIDEFDDIFAALLNDVFFSEFALGERDLTVAKLFSHFIHNLEKPFSNPTNRSPQRNLNHYIEAQVHGNVDLRKDVDRLVADPSFKQTQTGNLLAALSSKYGFELHWHAGFALPVSDVPSDFRGPSMPSLAKRVAQKDYFDVSMIGVAAESLKRSAQAWNDRGSFKDVLQELKLLWHVLVKFGSPFSRFEK